MATITGTSGNDSLAGTGSNDTLSGLGGNDTLNGNGGTDFFDGGAGFDTIDFRFSASPLVIDFGAGTISGGYSATFTGIERVPAGRTWPGRAVTTRYGARPATTRCGAGPPTTGSSSARRVPPTPIRWRTSN